MAQEVQEFNPDVIIECYLDAKYYHYDALELNDLTDFNANFAMMTRSLLLTTQTVMSTTPVLLLMRTSKS